MIGTTLKLAVAFQMLTAALIVSTPTTEACPDGMQPGDRWCEDCFWTPAGGGYNAWVEGFYCDEFETKAGGGQWSFWYQYHPQNFEVACEGPESSCETWAEEQEPIDP